MQQNTDPNSGYYQYYQNPHPDPHPDPQYGAVSASAPPFSPTDPHHYQYPDLAPAPHSYSFPHLNNPQFYPNNYHNTPAPNPNPNHGLFPDRDDNRATAGNYGYTTDSAFSDPNNRAAGKHDYTAGSAVSDRNNRAAGTYDYTAGSAFSNQNNRAAGNHDYTAGSAFSDPNNRAAGNYDYTSGSDSAPSYEPGSYGGGVYAYSGGNKELYGARGTGSRGSSGVVFDDYGRPIGGGNAGKGNGSGVSKVALKAEVVEHDVVGGVEKFRARLLSEGAGQTEMDVLCQIGLDGIKILDPATSRTLRIYPLESVASWEVLDSYIFAFWAKTTIDMESKRIRLKSNSYTSNNMLDTVTAASFQLKEIGETKKPYDAVKASEQASEKKKGFPDWMNLMKPRNEEKDYWVPDEAVSKCTACGTDFNAFNRRHHCRNCGDIFCDKCTQGRIELTTDENDVPVRVCDRCMAEVTQRLTNVKESAGKVATLQSHADLAKKLKEEMEKNRKTSTGLTSSGSGTRMKDVACPTCTVHLQVQVPSSGSETIECSVCQHPFLVYA